MPGELLIDGPAGTGKTYGILSVIHHLSWNYPGLRVLICRQSRASLTESVLATFEDEILVADGATEVASGERRDHRSNYRYENTSKTVLVGLDRPDRALSTAWDIIYINEAIEVKEDAWQKLSSRLNRPGRDRRFGFLIADTNPGDPAHWLKKRCDEGRMTRWHTTHEANPGLFDQNGWTEYWEPYRQRLDRLTGTSRKRLKDGLWAAGEGTWFGSTFDPDRHVTSFAEYDPDYRVHLAVDTGVHTGAVWFQIIDADDGDGPILSVFADYYSYNAHAYTNAVAILDVCSERCEGGFDVGRYDPAGGAKSGFGGITIASEYERAGLYLHPWPKFQGCELAGLNLLESFIAVENPARFRVHPRCVHLIDALTNFKRKSRGGQYIDEADGNQHPYDDMVDSLRSGLLDKYPEGRIHGGPTIGTFGPQYKSLHSRRLDY